MATRRKVDSKDDLRPGECLCDFCYGKCCRYFALPIDAPTTWHDFDNMRWYLMHGRCSVFVDGGTWYLLVYGDCKHLLPDNRCGTYHTRPQICRDYSTDNCEYGDSGCYDKFFESPEQVWEYAEAILPPRKTPGQKRGQPALPTLPIIN